MLCDYQTNIAATVADHIRALESLSEHRYYRLSMLGDIPADCDLSRFDAIVVHYTLVACMDFYLSPAARARISAFPGLKVLFIQDEYRHVDESIAAMRELGINVLFTCVPEGEIEKVYSDAALPGVRKVNVLTGYVPAELLSRKAPSMDRRSIDVGYRGRKVPAWLGELGQEKWRIGIGFSEEALPIGLVCDISYREEDRLYGDAWIDFVTKCKACLESKAARASSTSAAISKGMSTATSPVSRTRPFEALRDLYFSNEEGKISLAQISPRSFESAALRTLMILYEGEYSGILMPWRHYVPLQEGSLEYGRGRRRSARPEALSEITDCAYQEVALDPKNSFRAFVSKPTQVLREAWRPEMQAAGEPYSMAQFRWRVALNPSTLKRRGISQSSRARSIG